MFNCVSILGLSVNLYRVNDTTGLQYIMTAHQEIESIKVEYLRSTRLLESILSMENLTVVDLSSYIYNLTLEDLNLTGKYPKKIQTLKLKPAYTQRIE